MEKETQDKNEEEEMTHQCIILTNRFVRMRERSEDKTKIGDIGW